MGVPEWIAKCVEKMVSENEFVAGVVLFGSIARGEESDRSDVDLLILWEGLEVDPRERHVYIYKVVSRYFPPSTGLTVLDMEYSRFVSARKLTSLLLNIMYDGVVLYDKHGLLEDFLSRVRKELRAKGLERRRAGKYYYWVLPRPGNKIELEV